MWLNKNDKGNTYCYRYETPSGVESSMFRGLCPKSLTQRFGLWMLRPNTLDDLIEGLSRSLLSNNGLHPSLLDCALSGLGSPLSQRHRCKTLGTHLLHCSDRVLGILLSVVIRAKPSEHIYSFQSLFGQSPRNTSHISHLTFHISKR